MQSMSSVYRKVAATGESLVVEGYDWIARRSVGDVFVRDGGVLHLSGTMEGTLIVESGGHVTFGGTLRGHLVVLEEARVEMTGRLLGEVVHNEGELIAAVGSTVNGYEVHKTGTFVWSTRKFVFISPRTRRFHLHGTGSELVVGREHPRSDRRS